MRRILSVLCFSLLPALLFAQKEYRRPSSAFSTSITDPIVPSGEQIVIPVIIHIVYSGSGIAISMDQVNSQIDALNRDFNARNEDRLLAPPYFKDLVADCGIRFELAKVDPAGNVSSGVVYKTTNRQLFGLDNEVKFSAKGGDDAWPRDHYLNIWVCNMLSSIQGYTSEMDGPPELDGIVLNKEVFGKVSSASDYGMGRIAVHETGHWLGLKHIWGDGYCGDDGIDDTPQQKSYNKGCPSGIMVSCGSGVTGDMYMNFMDRTNDACMFMFTEGQKKKMRSMFEPGNLRNPILSSGALGETGQIIEQYWGKTKTGPASIKHIGIWPVPASGLINVDLSEFEDIAGKPVIVYNMAGQPLMSIQVTGKQVSLDVSALSRGQYLLKVVQSTAPPAKFLKL